ncbi:hypothetical protein [Noviherbaspirillum sedimenti]|uniref:Uncharacterized protein n=1 Tax=Noviherbaspirillum sedimenti TaxID=2320865 RepID=A0A3A3GHR0_9BURK|nr:hypothetical protein [Noviherbaspirillum sedimenti]RJG01806.1 hypothetical protein D3878_09615 [Noviherbaspirillum sedimenti]
MKRKSTGIAAMAVATLFSGCGGSDSAAITENFTIGPSTTTTLATGSAQGLYEGVASNGRYFNTLVLENDQFTIIYGNRLNNVFTVTGLITGSGQSGNGSFSSTDLKDFPAGGIPLAGTLSASFIPATSFNAVVNRAGQAITFAGTVPSSTSYVYNSLANLADIVGAWDMTTLTGEPVALNIAANGSFTAASAGCGFTGTIAPRVSGRNVFNVVITFGPAPCVLASQTVSGHAVTYLLGNGQRQLIAAATDATKNNATVVFGAR